MIYAELGIDGNCGYAIINGNLAEEGAEFVEIVATTASGNASDADKRFAAMKAYDILKKRRKARSDYITFYYGTSYPGMY
jgi:hypothetical protein